MTSDITIFDIMEYLSKLTTTTETNYFNFYFNYSLVNENQETNKYKFLEDHLKQRKYKQEYNLSHKKFSNELFKKTNNMNKLRLTPTQQVISKILKNKSCVIIYLGLFYNIKTKQWNKKELLKEIVHTCIKLYIPVIIIGENNPVSFIPRLNITLKAFFSKSNYITPYHYKQRWFDTPIRLPNNDIHKTPCRVSLNQMIDDIIDQYQIEETNCLKIINEQNLNF